MKRVYTRLPEQTAARLEAIAKQQHRSLGAQVAHAVGEWLKR